MKQSNILTEILNCQKKAMKRKDKTVILAYRMILSSIAGKQKELEIEYKKSKLFSDDIKFNLKDEDILLILKKEIKELTEELEYNIKSGNDVNCLQLKRKIYTLNSHIPEQISQSKLKTLILTYCEKNNLQISNKNRKNIVSYMIDTYGLTTDSSSVNRAISSLIAADK
jgi:uncharacterized protein YqeY